MDISVSFPNEGCIRLKSRFLFADPAGPHCRKFVERVLNVYGVNSVAIKGQGTLFGANMAEIRYCRRSWELILLPNGLCIVGAFTLGFGVMTSVLTNNVAALAALANGMLPLRRIAEAQAQSQLEQDQRLARAIPGRDEPVAVTEVELLPEGMANGYEGVVVIELETPAGDILIEPGDRAIIEPEAPSGGLQAEGQGVMVVEFDPAADRLSEPRLTIEEKRGPSGFGELQFERPLKRPLDDELRRQVLESANRRRGQLPFPAEFEWHPVDPVLSVKSSLLPIHVTFDSERMAVYARMSLTTRMLATDANRKRASHFIEEIADELGL